MDFGYSLTPSSRIDLDSIDNSKLKSIASIEPDILKCMACGSCTASCSAGKFKYTSLRNAILDIQNGNDKQALEVLNGCMLCGKCTLVCPRGINTRHLILSICKIYNE